MIIKTRNSLLRILTEKTSAAVAIRIITEVDIAAGETAAGVETGMQSATEGSTIYVANLWNFWLNNTD